MTLYLGIEIGGTKLQLGVGTAHGNRLEDVVRANVDVARGAAGILEQIRTLGGHLTDRYGVAGIGVGFGGPVDAGTGRVTQSHQVAGWKDFPLVDQLQQCFARPAAIDNDCNVAALAEAKLGAGRAASRVYYVTVGSGIGGGFVVEGRLEGRQRPAIAEIGHLRPGPQAVGPESTVESVASGWGIARRVRDLLARDDSSQAARELWGLCGGTLGSLTTQQIAAAAEQGNEMATQAISEAVCLLGWAIAQVITLVAPEVVVVGGGVSLIGDSFFEALREHSATFVFPPLADTYEIVPAALGDEVVVHGAVLLAAGANDLK